MPGETVRAIGDDGLGLVVDFWRRQDRFGHSISVVQGDRVWHLLESLEGTDLDLWPVSPPLQQLSVEIQDGSPVALLVGMAGKSHWSLSVQGFRERRELVFDVACRVREHPERLGSAYRQLASEAAATSDDPGCWRTDRWCCRLHPTDVADEASPMFVSDADQLMVLANPSANTPPATSRWKYMIRVEPVGESLRDS